MSKNQSNILQQIPVMGDEFELSLELSIGGPYSQPQNIKNLEIREEEAPANRDFPRSVFSPGAEDADLQKRRGIQALRRRREARMKREVKKSTDDRLLLEAQQFRARVESRERDGFTERKRDNKLLLPVVNGFGCPWVVPLWVGDGNEAPQSSPLQRKGESCSDSGSQSSDTKQGEGTGTGTDVVPNTSTSTNTSNTAVSNPRDAETSSSTANGLHMPCVSTTGNGPNGKTITGFLHKYTKSQVTIMCVCHGTFFTPAEFVEHAGAVDITHPLRHITVLPSILQ